MQDTYAILTRDAAVFETFVESRFVFIAQGSHHDQWQTHTIRKLAVGVRVRVRVRVRLGLGVRVRVRVGC